MNGIVEKMYSSEGGSICLTQRKCGDDEQSWNITDAVFGDISYLETRSAKIMNFYSHEKPKIMYRKQSRYPSKKQYENGAIRSQNQFVKNGLETCRTACDLITDCLDKLDRYTDHTIYEILLPNATVQTPAPITYL